MDTQPILSREEWQVVIELLEREQRDLPSEIHHTRTPNVHDQLHHRLELIQGLLDRLQLPVHNQAPLSH
ncbi:MAG TPA: hypothetical protein VKV15_11685 [Bryobacteraceae bacterium]|nr:hypothetical protein [Bryobacteraceae bacterium]